MLTEQQKGIIVLEERFRQETRAALAAQPSKVERIVDWLSKPIVIWFMSSIVLAGVTTLHSNLIANRQAEMKAEQRANALELELTLRMIRLPRLVTAFEEGRTLWSVLLTDGGASKEFNQTDLLSLAVEYDILSSSRESRTILEKVKQLNQSEPQGKIEGAKAFRHAISTIEACLDQSD